MGKKKSKKEQESTPTWTLVEEGPEFLYHGEKVRKNLYAHSDGSGTCSFFVHINTGNYCYQLDCLKLY